MLQFALDTDHLTLWEHGHPLVTQRGAQHALGVVGLTVVTIEESLRGRLTALAQARDGSSRIGRYRLLLESTQRFAMFPVVPYDQSAEDQYQKILSARLRIGSRDQKIAAIALANQLVLVTRNQRDFGQIPALRLEDWSV